MGGGGGGQANAYPPYQKYHFSYKWAWVNFILCVRTKLVRSNVIDVNKKIGCVRLANIKKRETKMAVLISSTGNKVQLYFTEMNSRYFKHCNGIFVDNYLLTVVTRNNESPK